MNENVDSSARDSRYIVTFTFLLAFLGYFGGWLCTKLGKLQKMFLYVLVQQTNGGINSCIFYDREHKTKDVTGQQPQFQRKS